MSLYESKYLKYKQKYLSSLKKYQDIILKGGSSKLKKQEDTQLKKQEEAIEESVQETSEIIKDSKIRAFYKSFMMQNTIPTEFDIKLIIELDKIPIKIDKIQNEINDEKEAKAKAEEAKAKAEEAKEKVEADAQETPLKEIEKFIEKLLVLVALLQQIKKRKEMYNKKQEQSEYNNTVLAELAYILKNIEESVELKNIEESVELKTNPDLKLIVKYIIQIVILLYEINIDETLMIHFECIIFDIFKIILMIISYPEDKIVWKYWITINKTRKNLLNNDGNKIDLNADYLNIPYITKENFYITKRKFKKNSEYLRYELNSDLNFLNQYNANLIKKREEELNIMNIIRIIINDIEIDYEETIDNTLTQLNKLLNETNLKEKYSTVEKNKNIFYKTLYNQLDKNYIFYDPLYNKIKNSIKVRLVELKKNIEDLLKKKNLNLFEILTFFRIFNTAIVLISFILINKIPNIIESNFFISIWEKISNSGVGDSGSVAEEDGGGDGDNVKENSISILFQDENEYFGYCMREMREYIYIID